MKNAFRIAVFWRLDLDGLVPALRVLQDLSRVSVAPSAQLTFSCEHFCGFAPKMIQIG